jgi:hypothetical protein
MFMTLINFLCNRATKKNGPRLYPNTGNTSIEVIRVVRVRTAKVKERKRNTGTLKLETIR